MIGRLRLAAAVAVLSGGLGAAEASCGDPQVMTDHPWYPGELSCSTFERLFETQKKLYERVTGRRVRTDEDKAIASWYWRNLNYAHFNHGRPDQFNQGFTKADINRDYWTGLFAHGGGLCFTTHAQWAAEMQHLFGPNRARITCVPGHTSFEVFLKGGPYAGGKWVLLDHDVSTIVFSEDGTRLISIKEISESYEKYTDPNFKPERQRGWLVGGLHHKDPKAYKRVKHVGVCPGYAGAPPIVCLRAGESLKRFPRPGLEDGKTFLYWGYNYTVKGVPGPSRHRTWVNQPEKMFRARKCTPYIPGMARYGNAVYTYRPDFEGGGYKEGVIDEGDDHVTFEFYTPYVIAAAPKTLLKNKYDTYAPGATNGLVLKGNMTCPVQVSTDQGRTWQSAGDARDGMDLTDFVKGGQQYFVRFDAGAKALAKSDLTMRTVCQMNSTLVPRLTDGGTKVSFEATGRAVVRLGPNLDQVQARTVKGSVNSHDVTLEFRTPRGEEAVGLYAASWQMSGCPPKPSRYSILYSADGGRAWKPVVRDHEIELLGYQPDDWWSQSMTFGEAELDGVTGPVLVRFFNTGRRRYKKVDAYLVYEVSRQGPVTVTFAWKEGGGGKLKTASHTYSAAKGRRDTSWTIGTGRNVETQWVEYSVE